MTYLVIGLLLGYLVAIVVSDLLEEYRAPKAQKGSTRRARTHVHPKQTRKARQKRKTR